eukprot:g3971.t1
MGGCASAVKPQDNYQIRYLAEGEEPHRHMVNRDEKARAKAKYKLELSKKREGKNGKDSQRDPSPHDGDGGKAQRSQSTPQLDGRKKAGPGPRRSLTQTKGRGGGRANARWKKATTSVRAAVRMKRNARDPNHWIGSGLMSNRGKYRLAEFAVEKKPLGKGSAGYVKLARHLTDNGYYALKLVSKEKVIKHKNGPKHLRNEKNILATLSSPFFIKCFGTFQDPVFVYFVLSYVPGGELHRLLFVNKRFSNDMAMFYSAELLSAITYMHSLNILYRDLKPENILIGIDGHVVICDLGFASLVDQDGKCFTKVGTPHYLAPEILDLHSNAGYTKAVDIWSWGLVTYEMLRGRPAFGTAHDTAYQVYLRVMKAKYKMPGDISSSAKQLIRKLLVAKIESRLVEAEEIMQQKWFENLDWTAVGQRRVSPPHFPVIEGPGDREAYEIRLKMPQYRKVTMQEDSYFTEF